MRSIKQLAAAAIAAFALSSTAPVPLLAQDKGTLVWGDTLPAGLDPHAIFDVPMQFILLNVYDTLYRYIGNPPELRPWRRRHLSFPRPRPIRAAHTNRQTPRIETTRWQ